MDSIHHAFNRNLIRAETEHLKLQAFRIGLALIPIIRLLPKFKASENQLVPGRFTNEIASPRKRSAALTVSKNLCFPRSTRKNGKK